LQPEASAFHAGRLMLDEIDRHIALGVDFGFETTLSGRSYLPMLGHLKKNNYKIHFFYLLVPTPDLASQRVADRVKAGGHDIPEPVLQRRFDRSLSNFFSRYRKLGDSWMIFDNSGRAPVLIAFEKEGRTGIIDEDLYAALMKRYGNA
jgi:predicted ABC-type ATPase